MENKKTNEMEDCPCFNEQNEDKKSEKQGMPKCMKAAKWFLLIPGVLIILAFLLSYFLEPDTVRTLWLILTGALIVIGATFYTLMNLWIYGLQKKIKVEN